MVNGLKNQKGALSVARARGEHVLVVEDNSSLREVVMRQLADIGYRVFPAENAAVAMEVLKREAIDLLFTDIVMPGETDGFALAARAREQRPELKVVFTSGFPEDRSRHGFSRGHARVESTEQAVPEG